jgi:hypothetical protein
LGDARDFFLQFEKVYNTHTTGSGFARLEDARDFLEH